MGSSPQPSGFALWLWWASQVINQSDNNDLNIGINSYSEQWKPCRGSLVILMCYFVIWNLRLALLSWEVPLACDERPLLTAIRRWWRKVYAGNHIFSDYLFYVRTIHVTTFYNSYATLIRPLCFGISHTKRLTVIGSFVSNVTMGQINKYVDICIVVYVSCIMSVEMHLYTYVIITAGSYFLSPFVFHIFR